MLIGYVSKRVWFILKLKVVQPITPRISSCLETRINPNIYYNQKSW